MQAREKKMSRKGVFAMNAAAAKQKLQTLPPNKKLYLKVTTEAANQERVRQNFESASRSAIQVTAPQGQKNIYCYFRLTSSGNIDACEMVKANIKTLGWARKTTFDYVVE